MASPNKSRPAWWRPGMPESETRVSEAAQRAADSAPDIRPGDEVHLSLRPLLNGWLTTPACEDRDAA